MKTFPFSILIFFLFNVSMICQNNWQMVSANENRTAYIKESTLNTPMELEKEIPLYCEHLIVVENIAYGINGGSPGSLTAYNINQEVELWSFEIPDTKGSIGFVPAVYKDKIFAGGQKGMGLYALDRFTGEQKWFNPIGNLFGKNPVVDKNGKIYITNVNILFCINAENGQIIWEHQSLDGYNTPTLYEELVLLSNSQSITALDTTTGTQIWKIDNLDANRGHLMADDSGIYARLNAKVCSYSENTENWCIEEVPNTVLADYNSGYACLTDSTIAYSIWSDGQGHSKLVCINKFSGETIWTFVADYEGITAPSAANGIIYVAGYNRSWVKAFDQMSGELLFEHSDQVFWGQPVIANERLMVAGQAGVSIFKSKPASTDKILAIEMKIRAFPNPFLESTNLKFEIKESGKVSIRFYDINGKKKLSVSERHYDPGVYEIKMNAGDLESGTYFYELTKGNIRLVGKMVKL